MRTASTERKTSETEVQIQLNLDGTGKAAITTGIGFLDHMLDQVARHGLIDIEITTKGDLHIDMHHTVEDVGIALGQAFRKALGDAAGITRYAHVLLPMDEALSRCAVDVSGRPFLVFDVDFPTPKIGDFDTELVQEWFRAFSMHAGLTLHVSNEYGSNSHHIAESAFKALGRSLRAAITLDSREDGRIPSTKGQLNG